MKKITYSFLIIILISNLSFAQKNDNLEKAKRYLREKGEVVFTFKAKNKAQFEKINNLVSIGHKQVDQHILEGEAYANSQQFQRFLALHVDYTVEADDNEIPQEFYSNTNRTTSAWDTTWDAYPKYSEYVAKMQYWAATYPSLCTLQSIGTTPNGRTLYVLKISDNVASDETEPEFFYTSSMHGDEITGYPTMLHFIDHLLTNYGTISEITNLVNGTELYICPLANPDGSYKTVGNDIFNSTGNTATRANANGYDLNRNYPDPIGGLHPDSGLQTNPVYQPETAAFLTFEATRNFVLAANYHGGAEVVNFPWDTSNSATGASAVNIHPHDSYYRFVSQEYAQLCQTADGDLNYMDDVYGTGQFPGTTNGAIWYTVKGGRQDYNNFFNHNKEVTVEISVTKTPLASNLLFHWDRNKQALLNFIKQANYGLHGIVSNTNGNPIHAKVYISGTTDASGSWVETSATKGDYHKVQIAGTYNVIFEAPGYVSQTIPITLTNTTTITLNVMMVPTVVLPTTSNDVTICQGSTTTLTASGGTINWYNSINATTPIATGTSYLTPALTTTTSYFAEIENTLSNVGPTTPTGTSSSNTAVANRYLIFNCTTPTKLKSVLINATAVGQILVELQDSTGKMLESKVIRLTASGSQDINLDFFLPAQNNLRLVSRQITYTNLLVATSGITYPLTNGTVSITANSGSGTFLPFFNWKFNSSKGLRKEIIITVTPTPTTSTTSPTTVNSGSSDFILTVNGSNFINGESVVRWNGTNRVTTFVNSSQLTAVINAADVVNSGTATVTVFNNCGVSNGQIFTVFSPCAPVPDISVLPTINNQCSAASPSAPTATSSCTGSVIGTTATVFPITNQGTTIVTWTYNDGNGNTSTQNQTVIVDDTIAPVPNVPNLPNATGQSTVTVTAPTATDNCVGSIIGTTPSPLTYSTQGTFIIVWTYNDGNGNSTTQNQTVIVADTIAPTAPLNLIASGTTSSTTNLSWSASSDNIAVTGYNVYRGGTLLATVATTTYPVTGLTPLTAYTFSVIARDAVGNLSTSSNSVNVTTLAAAYCISQGTSVANELIGKVVFGTINNTSTGGTGYQNFTAISSNITRGTAYTITITPTWTGTKRNEGFAVWIDYNGDGDFADSGEQVWTKVPSKTTPVSGTFTIPATATLGATRMRVSMKFNAIPTSCETFPSGQVEDYTVNIVSSARIFDTESIENIQIYPNPVKGNELYIFNLEIGSYRIFNSLGQQIANGTISNGTIPISDITTGAYLIELISNNKTVVKRFIKK